jgi:hypothetical protein
MSRHGRHALTALGLCGLALRVLLPQAPERFQDPHLIGSAQPLDRR